MASKARKKAEKAGRRAELWAQLWLCLKGYHILERRYKTKLGEIDIIAKKNNVLAFIEFKRRATLEAGHAALHSYSLRRIEETAALYQGQNINLEDLEMRFDVVFALPRLRLVHLKDAWRSY